MATAIGTRIQTLRKAVGLSRRQFGEKIGKPQSSIAYLETYEKAKVSDGIVDLICDTYGVRKEWLISGQGEMFQEDSPAGNAEHSDLKDRLKSIREKEGLLQKDFAAQLGCSLDHIKSLEQGRTKASDAFLAHVAEMFGVSFEWLRSGYEDKKGDDLRRIYRYIDRNEEAQKALLAIMELDGEVWNEIMTVVLRKKEKEITKY